LGVILDERLTFKPHVDKATKTAGQIISKLGVFSKEIGGAPAQINLMLYKSCILLQLEYGYPVWCGSKHADNIHSIQYTALRKALGVLDKSSGAKIELLAHILPIDIRLDTTLIMAFIRIFRQPPSNRLRQLVSKLMTCPRHQDHRIITPIHKFKMASRYLMDFNLTDIEEIYHETVSDITRKRPTLADFDTDLGSAGSRSAEQAATAKKRIEDYLVQNIDSTIAYTDGSALKNPGPCGAGAAIFKTGHSMHPTELERPVSKKSHSYHGELQALDLCLDKMVKCPPNHLTPKLIILSDCQSALITAASPKISKEFTELQIKIQQAVENLHNKGHNVQLKWVPGHTDLTGNDLADRLAKSAATLASNGDFRSTLSLTEAKNALKAKAVNRWKYRIERTLNNHQYLPQPSTKSFKSSMSRIAETRFHRLVLNHTLLRIHRSKMFPEQYPSPDCECGTDVQSIDHYLLNCPLIENQITSLVNSIDAGFVKTSTQTHLRFINRSVLLGENHHLKPDMRKEISSAMNTFLSTTLCHDV
jgi:ribonuclease HI